MMPISLPAVSISLRILANGFRFPLRATETRHGWSLRNVAGSPASNRDGDCPLSLVSWEGEFHSRRHYSAATSLEGRELNQDKLAPAVHAAIDFCGSAEDRYVRLLEFMDHLKGDEHWCDAELAELHERVKQFLSEPDRLA